MKAEFLSIGHRLHVYDATGQEIGLIKEKVFTLLPVFEIYISGEYCGLVEKKFTLFRPKYEINVNGWRVEGDFLGWEHDVYEACSSVAHITKELLYWGDTYAIDIVDSGDELMAMMLVITIDAANCTQNNS